MRREKNFGKNTHITSIAVICASLLVGCTSLPNKQPPTTLGISQIHGKDGKPDEYVFCDMNGGAWACDPVTAKTPVAVTSKELPPDNDPGVSVNAAVKAAIKEARNIASPVGDESPTAPPLGVVYFEFDSSVLTAKAKMSLLDLLPSLVGRSVEIHGYTDNLGSEEYNAALGEQRAQAVHDFLIRASSDANAVTAYGHGRCCYVVPNDGEEQQAMNRRAEIFTVD